MHLVDEFENFIRINPSYLVAGKGKLSQGLTFMDYTYCKHGNDECG